MPSQLHFLNLFLAPVWCEFSSYFTDFCTARLVWLDFVLNWLTATLLAHKTNIQHNHISYNDDDSHNNRSTCGLIKPTVINTWLQSTFPLQAQNSPVPRVPNPFNCRPVLPYPLDCVYKLSGCFYALLLCSSVLGVPWPVHRFSVVTPRSRWSWLPPSMFEHTTDICILYCITVQIPWIQLIHRKLNAAAGISSVITTTVKITICSDKLLQHICNTMKNA